MIKKTLIGIAALTMLTACSEHEATKDNEVTNKVSSQLQENQVEQQENEQLEQPAEHVQESQENDNEWTSLPEYNKIIEQIDDKDVHFEKVTDSSDKRILLIIDENGTKLYKSIFIKNTKRLKIINVKGGGQIFNEVLS